MANKAKHITASDWLKSHHWIVHSGLPGGCAVNVSTAEISYDRGTWCGSYDVCDHGITDRIAALETIITHKISRNWPLVDWCSLFRRKTDVYLGRTFPGGSNFSWTSMSQWPPEMKAKSEKKPLQSMSCSVFLRLDSNVNAANYMNQRLLSCQLGGTPIQSVWLVHCSQLSFNL